MYVLSASTMTKGANVNNSDKGFDSDNGEGEVFLFLIIAALPLIVILALIGILGLISGG